MSLKTWFIATRPWSLVMTFVSSCLAGILAYSSGSFEPAIFLVNMAGLMIAHMASNMTNDYYDVKHGVDVDAPTSKYRPHPLLLGKIDSETYKRAVTILYLIGIAIAVFLAWVRGLLVLVFAGLGLLFSVFYTADPIRYKYRSVGELAVFLVWGPLMVGGSYYVLTGELAIGPILASTPIGLLVALVLLANNLRDTEYDESVGINTVAIAAGQGGGLDLYTAIIVATYASTALLVMGGLLSPFSFITFLTIKEALDIVDMFREDIPVAADPITAQLALHFGVLLTIGEIINVALNTL